MEVIDDHIGAGNNRLVTNDKSQINLSRSKWKALLRDFFSDRVLKFLRREEVFVCTSFLTSLTLARGIEAIDSGSQLRFFDEMTALIVV